MPKPDNHPSKRPMWVMIAYLIGVAVLGMGLIYFMTPQADRNSSPAERTEVAAARA